MCFRKSCQPLTIVRRTYNAPIKILGFLVDEQLTGEAQCAAAARRADRATGAIRRAAKYLAARDRLQLAEALALPHLDYCQTAMIDNSEGAEDMKRRAYNRMLRMAAREKRSAPARKKLERPEWDDREEAIREKFVAKVYYGGEPEVLRELFPEKLKGNMQTRAMSRGELEEPQNWSSIGGKAFRVWAPQVINEIPQQESTPQ